MKHLIHIGVTEFSINMACRDWRGFAVFRRFKLYAP